MNITRKSFVRTLLSSLVALPAAVGALGKVKKAAAPVDALEFDNGSKIWITSTPSGHDPYYSNMVMKARQHGFSEAIRKNYQAELSKLFEVDMDKVWDGLAEHQSNLHAFGHAETKIRINDANDEIEFDTSPGVYLE